MIEFQTSDASIDSSVETHLVAPQGAVPFDSVSWSGRRHFAYCWQSLRFGIPLLITDVAVVMSTLFAVVGCATLIGFRLNDNIVWVLGGLQCISFVGYLTGMRLYRNVGMHPVEELQRVVTATFLAFVTLLMIFLWRNDGDVWLEIACILISGGLSVVVLPSVRHFVRVCLGTTRWWRYPVIILNPSDHSEKLIRELTREGHLGWRPIGYIDDFQSNWNRRENASKYCVGGEEDLAEVIERENIFWGISDSSSAHDTNLQRLLDRYHPDLPNIVSIVSGKGHASLFSHNIDCGNISGFCYRSSLVLLIPRVMKRLSDIVFSILAILCLIPVFALLMIAVRLSGRGPIFYSQDRIGVDGNTFRIWKFRSMVHDADRVLKSYLAKDSSLRAEWQKTQKLVYDPRVTMIGRILRRSSLDELPQLWNVLNGSMSLVGPRPIVRTEIEKYGNVIGLYYRTKPGITGLWQVSGRNLTTYEERLTFDSFYVRNWSIWLDWSILLKTVRVVVLCEGAY